MYAVGFVCSAGDDLVEENDVTGPFADRDIQVLYVYQEFGEFCELVVMCGEEGSAFYFVCDVFGDGPCEREAVIGAGSASYFVEDDD